MMLNFLPAGRNIIQPIDLHAAISRAVHDLPSADVNIYADDNGNIEIVSLNRPGFVGGSGV